MATYTFLLRAYFYNDDILEQAENALMQATGMTFKYLHRVFYNSYRKGFCKKGNNKEKAQRPTINVHVFQHLLESRKKSGEVHLTPTEPFEAFYSVLRRCYRAGTRNTTKQSFENFFINEKYVTVLFLVKCRSTNIFNIAGSPTRAAAQGRSGSRRWGRAAKLEITSFR